MLRTSAQPGGPCSKRCTCKCKRSIKTHFLNNNKILFSPINRPVVLLAWYYGEGWFRWLVLVGAALQPRVQLLLKAMPEPGISNEHNGIRLFCGNLVFGFPNKNFFLPSVKLKLKILKKDWLFCAKYGVQLSPLDLRRRRPPDGGAGEIERPPLRRRDGAVPPARLRCDLRPPRLQQDGQGHRLWVQRQPGLPPLDPTLVPPVVAVVGSVGDAQVVATLRGGVLHAEKNKISFFIIKMWETTKLTTGGLLVCT